jgi:hypothetical protein
MDAIIAVFKAHITNLYGSDIAEWSVEYWRNITEQ